MGKIRKIEYLLLGLIGLVTTIYIGNVEFSYMKGGYFMPISPFEYGLFVLRKLNVAPATTLLFQYVLLMSMSFLNVIYVDCSRAVVAKELLWDFVPAVIPLMSFFLGPGASLPLVAYFLAQAYDRFQQREELENNQKQKDKNKDVNGFDIAPNAIMMIYLCSANLVALVVGEILIPASLTRPKLNVNTVKIDRTLSTIFVAAPLCLALFTFLQITNEKIKATRREREGRHYPLNHEEGTTLHKFSTTAHILAAGLFLTIGISGFILHLWSIYNFISAIDVDDFILASFSNATSSLFVLNFSIVLSAMYLWLDNGSTVLLGGNRYHETLLSYKDFAAIVVFGPVTHFNAALFARELEMLTMERKDK